MPTVRLTEIFRQAAESLIVVNAHRIHDGDLPELGAATGGEDKRDFFFLEEDDPAKAALVIRDLVAARLPAQIRLCTRTRSRCCRRCTAGSSAPATSTSCCRRR